MSMNYITLWKRKQVSCFHPSCIDHILTNNAMAFHNTTANFTGLSDFHKLVLTVLKTGITKSALRKEPHSSYYRAPLVNASVLWTITMLNCNLVLGNLRTMNSLNFTNFFSDGMLYGKRQLLLLSQSRFKQLLSASLADK